MQADLSQVSRLIFELLEDSAPKPEIAARLKQRLNLSLSNSGFDPFDEKVHGSKRFKDFLHKHFAEMLTLVPPLGQGDVLVSLKEQHTALAAVAHTPTAGSTGSLDKPVVRADVWQAFLNQDKDRRRFFSKADKKVVHYRNGEPAEIKAIVDANPGGYVEISPLPEAAQLDWFRAFLHKNPPSSRIAGAIQQLLDADPGSVMIDAISHMLGATEDTWRAQRVRSIYAHIVNWCSENAIDPNLITNPPKSQTSSRAVPASNAVESPAPVRKQAQAILDSLSDNDIAQIVLPILVTTVLVKART